MTSGCVWDPGIEAELESSLHLPFTALEIASAAGRMARGKTTTLARYPLELLRVPPHSALWRILAVLFNRFVTSGFPSRLSHMLFMLVYKWGDASDPDNYRGISLMHPVARLFSKVLTARLERDPAAVHAPR